MKFNWKLLQNWCHAGIPQGNGLFGSLIWGDNKNIKITVNRSDYWFHGENLPPAPEQSYQNLKQFLENGDEEKLRRVFGGEKSGVAPLRSTRLPVGRLLINLPETNGRGTLSLNTDTSAAEVIIDTVKIKSIVPRNLPVIALSFSGETYRACSFTSSPPTAQEVKDFFKANDFPSPVILDAADGMSGGWIQDGRKAQPLCLLWEKVERPLPWNCIWSLLLETHQNRHRIKRRLCLSG